jgi:DNA invertase Pin-like site-specific DNA recombinase
VTDLLIPVMRQSVKRERTISIEEQRRDIVGWASSADVELAPEVVEQGVSGAKPWQERGLGLAISACQRGEADGIIVAWQDRLSRENGLATMEVWQALEKAGARLVCAAEGLDTATGDQELSFAIKAAIARDQWKRHRANWERAKRQAREKGVLPQRTPDFGYRRSDSAHVVVEKAEAKQLVDLFQRRAAGESFSALGRRFGWSHSTTRQRIMNANYMGVDGLIPKIIDRDLWERANSTSTKHPVPPGATTEHLLLKGIARCGGCTKTLKAPRAPRKDGTFVQSYFCKNASTEPCPCRAYVHTDKLDAFVATWFESALASEPRLIDAVAAGAELAEAEAERGAAEADLENFVTVASVGLKPTMLQRGLDVRQARADEAAARVRELSGRATALPSLGSILDIWRGSDVAARREILRGYLDHVEVTRGASGDLASHVTIVWADGSVADLEDHVGMLAA